MNTINSFAIAKNTLRIARFTALKIYLHSKLLDTKRTAMQLSKYKLFESTSNSNFNLHKAKNCDHWQIRQGRERDLALFATVSNFKD